MIKIVEKKIGVEIKVKPECNSREEITVKAGNFVTFFAQINFFLKNALR